MSTENTPAIDAGNVETISDDLDTFSADFFGQNDAQPEQASPEKVDTVEEVPDATTTDDTHVDEDPDKDLDDDEQDEDEDQEEPEAKPEKPKSRAEKRIEELNKKYRETERLVKELQAQLEKKNDPIPATTAKNEEVNTSPSPTDLNEDGTDKYPLGEFDPDYIRDMTTHIFDEKQKELDARFAQTQEAREVEAAKAALQSDWAEKLGPAKERYPDFDDKGEQLFDTFADVDPEYGEYLASTLMQMEYGPDVLYYLASNTDEARRIVDGGPLKATIALGRLESKFADASEQKQKARPKVSQAPVPPSHTNKGSAVSMPEIPADTDDLDAFSKQFFKK